jgi:hypothetical protein
VVVVLGLPKSNQVEKRECAEEGERGKQIGVAEWSGFIGIWSFVLPVMTESGEGFLSDGGIDWGEVKGRKEGERGVLIGRGLMAITREKLVGALLRRVPFPERREETVEVMMLTCRSRWAVTERGGEGYPFGI